MDALEKEMRICKLEKKKKNARKKGLVTELSTFSQTPQKDVLLR